MSLSIKKGSYNKASTQIAKDGYIHVEATGGVEPYLYRAYSYTKGQFTEWTLENYIKNLEIGFYYLEVLDGEGTIHPYPMGEIKAEKTVEEEKGDGAEFVLDIKDQSVYKFKNVPAFDNESTESIGIGELDVMINNMTYHEDSFEYPFIDTGCFYSISEISKLPFADWRVPTYNDYMYILNQIPELSQMGIRDFFKNQLNFKYEGFIERGYEQHGIKVQPRLIFKDFYAQYWVDKSSFKKKFAMSLCAEDFEKFTPLQMMWKPYNQVEDYTLNLIQARLVRNTGNQAPVVSKLTLLKGWNFVKFPVSFNGMEISEIFTLNKEQIVQMKTDDGVTPVGIFINDIPGIFPEFNTIGKIDSTREYFIEVKDSFRLEF